MKGKRLLENVFVLFVIFDVSIQHQHYRFRQQHTHTKCTRIRNHTDVEFTREYCKCNEIIKWIQHSQKYVFVQYKRFEDFIDVSQRKHFFVCLGIFRHVETGKMFSQKCSLLPLLLVLCVRVYVFNLNCLQT